MMPRASRLNLPSGVWFPAWQQHAACRHTDPDLFFYDDNERGNIRLRREAAAKAICAACPVLAECAQFVAETRPAYGIWAGLTEAERGLEGGHPTRRRRP